MSARPGHHVARPMARGTALALAAAVLFGAMAPLVQRFGRGVGPFATAALLYAGAAVASGARVRAAGEPRLGRRELRRIVLVAIFGAALAPALLAWGLQRTSALASALLLNLEAVFTIVLARAIHREMLGRRAAYAIALMIAGGLLLAARAETRGASSALGLVAIAAATLAWAIDNTLTRPLADFDPRAVVLGKATCGAVLAGALAAARREAWPAPRDMIALVVLGATGFGFSLVLYLRAQRTLGVARTGSVFAFAPFVGAAIAFALGDRSEPLLVAIAAVAFGVAAFLHATEAHGHAHVHESVEHEHAHRHDDGHHTHAHDPPFAGEHSHPHHHDRIAHDHPHGADLHHVHEHR